MPGARVRVRILRRLRERLIARLDGRRRRRRATRSALGRAPAPSSSHWSEPARGRRRIARLGWEEVETVVGGLAGDASLWRRLRRAPRPSATTASSSRAVGSRRPDRALSRGSGRFDARRRSRCSTWRRSSVRRSIAGRPLPVVADGGVDAAPPALAARERLKLAPGVPERACRPIAVPLLRVGAPRDARPTPATSASSSSTSRRYRRQHHFHTQLLSPRATLHGPYPNDFATWGDQVSFSARSSASSIRRTSPTSRAFASRS
jgi:hypothetical protein